MPTRRPPSILSRRRDAAEPPRLAVALEYRWPRAEAPAVVATGRAAVADRIVEAAEAAGVPVRSDADLVQVLSGLEIGQRIPLEAFAAVAEILAYLYRLNGGLPPTGVDRDATGRAETGAPAVRPIPEENSR